MNKDKVVVRAKQGEGMSYKNKVKLLKGLINKKRQPN